MNLSRHALVAGIAVLGVAVSASPAMAKGGGGDGVGDTKANNSVVTFINPDIVFPVITKNGGSNRPSRPRA
jgi:hypothetical protein